MPEDAPRLAEQIQNSARDTSPEADAVQLECYRRMGGAGRAQVTFQLCQMARETASAGIRARHPEYHSAQVKRALARLAFGDELVRRAWPGEPLPEP